MTVVGFEPGRRNGMKFHYAFRFDPELPENEFVFSRFPCGCDGCWKHNRLPIEKRYKEPRKDCILWPMMEIKDKTGKGTGKGHNDWRVGRFEMDQQSDERQYHAIMADTLQEMTARQVKQIVRGNFGAYFVAASKKKRKRGDENLPYYIVKWTQAPWQAAVDMEIYEGNERYMVEKGRWYCTGIWLEKLPGARNWFTMTEGLEGGWRTLVDLSKVAVANLRLLPRSEANQMRSGTRRSTIQVANERGAWRMADTDHAFLVEESQSREANEFDVKVAEEVLEEEAAKINPMSWAKKPEPMKEDPQKRKKKSRAKTEHLLQKNGPAGWKKKSSPKKKKNSKSSPKKRKSETSASAGRPSKRTRKRGGK